ncbi:hypothetical protein [Nitrolancea hollandica]|uniref:DUF3631 domain-containing protein n=1 Tax=Nitrolancea hollandica Lb TaxID=1129897 RepID=I4EK41_9BACT|nr:hypothetical protein [Nitrolancea hollandica]CCF85053.1 conserved hypothetical protein [Nitrolancea hollandica Lb]
MSATARELDADIEIVESPHRMSRLLGLLPDGRAYLATWLTIKVTTRETVNDAGEVVPLKAPKIEYRSELAILTREPDGKIKSWGPLNGSSVFPPDWDIRLRYQPSVECLISPAGFKRAMNGEQPNVPALFRRVVDVFDRFLDLSRGIAGQRDLAELLAVFAISTWLGDAYAAFPYLWPNGDKGAGKTKCLSLVARLGYLGQVILAGGTYAALRDLAEYGATLCFDDAENLADPRKSDPDKRALLLAGNRKGATVPVKEPEGKNGWRIRNVSAYCPKVFSAIRLPDPVLSRRTIVLPLVRSADPERANHDIEEDGYWPHDRRLLVDDLWIFGLHHLPTAKRAYGHAGSAELTGPGFEPWRPLLATAAVLEGAGVLGIVGRIRAVATAYQSEKADFEYPDATRLAVIAIAELTDVRTLSDVSDVSTQTPEWRNTNVRFTASSVAARINALAEDEGLVDDDETFTNSRKVGRILDRLRISKQRDPGKKRTRERTISRGDALKLLRAYAPSDVSEPSDTPLHKTSETSENVQTSGNGHGELTRCQVCGHLLPNAAARAIGMHHECAQEYESLLQYEKGA